MHKCDISCTILKENKHILQSISIISKLNNVSVFAEWLCPPYRIQVKTGHSKTVLDYLRTRNKCRFCHIWTFPCSLGCKVFARVKSHKRKDEEAQLARERCQMAIQAKSHPFTLVGRFGANVFCYSYLVFIPWFGSVIDYMLPAEAHALGCVLQLRPNLKKLSWWSPDYTF